MLNKLTLRNAKRSAGDYMIYIVTMTIISALMFALHGMIFSKNIQAMYVEMGIFGALIGLASFLVVLIIIWLIHYMVKFMMEKRSREFGTYLLLGMKRKEISRIFRRENLLLGAISMVLGILPGIFFQLAFTNIFYTIMNSDTRLTPELSIWNMLLTCGVLFLANMLALRRIKKQFRKMNIHDLMYAEKKNEQLKNEKLTWKKWLTFLSAAYIIAFNILALSASMTIRSVWIYLILLIAAIYLLYIGLSSFFISYLKKQHKGLYKKANIFVLRQLSSKIRTMQFTMGTLSILFTTALLGWTLVMMFGDFQQTQGQIDYPFDIIAYSDQPDAGFEEQLEIITSDTEVTDTHIYQTYENGTAPVNEYLYEHIDNTWREDREGISSDKHGGASYYEHDTYMKLSDYNHLRAMLGYKEVTLNEGNYLLHAKERVTSVSTDACNTSEITAGSDTLVLREVRDEPFSQNGMNGADYIIVITDGAAEHMRPYYSLLAVSTEGAIPEDLQTRLKAVEPFENPITSFPEYDIISGAGSNQLLSTSDTVLVKENVLTEMNFMVITMCYMLAYLGIVFLCAALTIMTIQQISDSSKYKFRYTILKNMGLSKKETDRVVLKQLAVYYFCPFLISIVLSIFIGMFISERFVYFTGVHAAIFQYYLLAVLVFAVLYLVYFTVTYISFIRNINR